MILYFQLLPVWPELSSPRCTGIKIGFLAFKNDSVSSVTSKNHQMSLKVFQKWFLLEKLEILTTLQKLTKNVGSLGKIIVGTGIEKLPKGQ